MANRIVGLDIGSWAVKAVTLEWQGQLEVVDAQQVELDGLVSSDQEGAIDGSVVPPAMPPVSTSDKIGGGGDEAQRLSDVPNVDEQEWEDAPMPPADGADPPWAEGAGADGDDGLAEADLEAGLGQTRWMQAIVELRRLGVFEDAHQIITAFPDGRAVTVHLDVPFERHQDVAEILPHLLVDKLPLAIDEIVHDFVVIPGKAPDLWEALVGVVQREEMAAFLDQCKEVKVDPAIVGVPELMLRYAGDQAAAPGVVNYGIIDLGHRFTRLLIMSEGKPVVAHTTQRGGQAVTDALAENFQISVEQAQQLKHGEGVVGSAAAGGDMQVAKIKGTIEESLRPVIRDLRRAFRSAFANYDVAVDVIYICGGTSRLQGLENFLTGEFEVPVEALDVSRGIDWSVDARARERAPQLALGLGCALQKPLDEQNRKLIDFRQGPFVFRGKSSYLRTQMVRFGAIAAVFFVLLVGVLLMQRYDRSTQLKVMQQAVAEQTRELFGEHLDSPSQIQARLEGDGSMNRNFVPQMSAYEQFYRTMDQIGADHVLELSRIEVDTDRSLIQLVGTTDSAQSVEAIANEAGRFECLSDVRTERVNVRGEDEVQFELQISSSCS